MKIASISILNYVKNNLLFSTMNKDSDGTIDNKAFLKNHINNKHRLNGPAWICMLKDCAGCSKIKHYVDGVFKITNN